MSRRQKKRSKDALNPSAAIPVSRPQSNTVPSDPPIAPVTKAVRRKFHWNDFKDRLIVWGFFAFIVSPVVGPLVFGIVYIPLYRGSLTSIEFTVDRRERVVKGGGENVQSYYLVWSKEGEVFCVTDTWSFLSFNSSDRYGKLHEGSRVNGKVAGWRVPFLSWYRNIVVIDSEESLAPP